MNIVAGKGAYLYDENGRAYFDGLCGLWNVSLGYGNDAIISAIHQQLTKLPYANLCEYRNDTAYELAERILAFLHEDMSKIYFTCTGSESNELAIKIIRKYQALQGRPYKNQIAVLSSSYHGSYYGSMSASQFEDGHKRGYGPFLEKFVCFDLPFCRCCMHGQLSEECLSKMIICLESEMSAHKDTLAGVIIEPVIGSGGIIPLPKKYLQKLEELCHKNDILLACDEVATGFGRTGTMFAYEQYDISPDILCMSKGINSGYLPLGAVAFHRKIETVFEKAQEPLFHLSTQNGNPACCAAALATLDHLEKDDFSILRNVRDMSQLLYSQLSQVLLEHPHVMDIRRAGLMIAIDLVESKASKELISENRLLYIVKSLRHNGLIAEYGYNPDVTSCITMFLPFIIQPAEVEKIISIINKSLQKFV